MLYIVIHLISEFCFFLITYIHVYIFIIFRYRKLKASENKTQRVIWGFDLHYLHQIVNVLDLWCA